MLNSCINETDCDKAFGATNTITTTSTTTTTTVAAAVAAAAAATTHFGDEEINEHIELQLGIAGLILQFIQLYYIPVLVVLGCIGNILSVFVFFCTKLRKHSSSYYLSALAFSDTGFLVTHFITWLNLVDIPIFKKSGFCQMTIYSSQVCSFLSVWLVVLFTVERFIAVRYPLHRPVVCTVARAKTFICGLTMIALPVYSPYFVMAAPQVITETTNNETFTTEGCYLVPQYADMAFYYNHIDVFFTLILPFCIIVILNTLICRTVHQLAHVRRTMTLTTRRRLSSNRNNSRRSSDGYIGRSFSHRASINSQSKVTQMLLVVSTVFICLNLPSYILRLWLYFNEYNNFMPFQQEVLSLLQHYSNILFATNFGINFVLYCISGQNFRKALCSFFHSKRSRQRQEHTQATVISECSRSAPGTNSIHQRKLTFNDSMMEMHQSFKNTVIATDSNSDTNHYMVVTSVQ